MVDRAEISNELFRFSTTASQWEQVDPTLVSGVPPSARSDPVMAAVGSDLFVFGGYTEYPVDQSYPYSSELFQFSTTAMEWEQLDAALVSGVPPSARGGHAMAAVGSDLFVFGGQTDWGEQARCACWT